MPQNLDANSIKPDVYFVRLYGNSFPLRESLDKNFHWTINDDDHSKGYLRISAYQAVLLHLHTCREQILAKAKHQKNICIRAFLGPCSVAGLTTSSSVHGFYTPVKFSGDTPVARESWRRRRIGTHLLPENLGVADVSEGTLVKYNDLTRCVIQQTEVDDHTKPAVCECQNSTTDSYLKR